MLMLVPFIFMNHANKSGRHSEIFRNVFLKFAILNTFSDSISLAGSKFMKTSFLIVSIFRIQESVSRYKMRRPNAAGVITSVHTMFARLLSRRNEIRNAVSQKRNWFFTNLPTKSSVKVFCFPGGPKPTFLCFVNFLPKEFESFWRKTRYLTQHTEYLQQVMGIVNV